jgi:hypothetical protein
MKRFLLYLLIVNVGAAGLHAQITPIIKANFGVEAGCEQISSMGLFKMEMTTGSEY